MAKKKDKPRIRKLTPHECWRLMNFDEKSFENAEKVNSNSQLYKQAGNSIVVACIIAIYMQLGIQGVPKWNDLTEEERYKIIYKDCYELKEEGIVL